MLLLTPSDFSLATASGPSTTVSWATSSNGQEVLDQGECAASLLPKDADVVLVLPPRAVSWHRVAIPKTSANKLRAVLDGLLEERMLEDTAQLHFALEPAGRPGRTLWVAACDKAWLRSWLEVLESVDRPATRMVPAVWPLSSGEPSGADVVHWAHSQEGQAWISSASAEGVSSMLLNAASPAFASAFEAFAEAKPAEARSSRFKTSRFQASKFPSSKFQSSKFQSSHFQASQFMADSVAHWLALPSVAEQTEARLGRPVQLFGLPQWLLRSARSGWNLAQFDFSLSGNARRNQRMRQSWLEWRTAPEWRPLRWGLAALVGVQLVALNASAWQEKRVIAAKKSSVTQTLRQAFPNVTVVLDAPAQMQRELSNLQQSAGVLSGGDLETMLAALDRASSSTVLPASVDFTLGEGRFSNWGGAQEGLASVKTALDSTGWQATVQGEELTLKPSKP